MKNDYLDELFRRVDQQIANKQKAIVGDRRSKVGEPPKGVDERRSGKDRRAETSKKDVLSRD